MKNGNLKIKNSLTTDEQKKKTNWKIANKFALVGIILGLFMLVILGMNRQAIYADLFKGFINKPTMLAANNVPTTLPSDYPSDIPSEIPTDTPIPTLAIPDFPSDMESNTQANWLEENDGNYWLNFYFNNPNNLNISINISPTEGQDPGSVYETTDSKWIFSELPSNTNLYVNMKVSINGNWSRVHSWIVQVPPTPTAISYPTVQPYDPSVQSNTNSDARYNAWQNCLKNVSNTITLPDGATVPLDGASIEGEMATCNSL